MYVKLRYSELDIADMCGVSRSTIIYWLKKYGIKIRGEDHIQISDHNIRESRMIIPFEFFLIKKGHFLRNAPVLETPMLLFSNREFCQPRASVPPGEA